MRGYYQVERVSGRHPPSRATPVPRSRSTRATSSPQRCRLLLSCIENWSEILSGPPGSQRLPAQRSGRRAGRARVRFQHNWHRRGIQFPMGSPTTCWFASLAVIWLAPGAACMSDSDHDTLTYRLARPVPPAFSALCAWILTGMKRAPTTRGRLCRHPPACARARSVLATSGSVPISGRTGMSSVPCPARSRSDEERGWSTIAIVASPCKQQFA